MAHIGGLLNELHAKSNKKKKKKAIEEINYEDCDVTYVYNALQTSPFSRYYLLLDVRDANAFNVSRIYQAIHLDINQIEDMNAIKNISDIPCNKPSSLKFIQSKKIIIYSHSRQDKNGSDKINALRALLIKSEKVRNCRIFCNGFDDFYNKYPFFLVSEGFKGMLAKYPHEIIEKKLYLGDGQQATTENIVSGLKITHIANISKEIKCAFPDKIKYIDVEIEDLENEDILCHIDKVVQFINDALKEDDVKEESDDNENTNRVLVHCEYGISRSSSMVISYLMHKKQWNFDKAKKFVKAKRPQISPNDGFVKQLKQYEESLNS